jgi:hypothetical protein
MYFPYLRGRQFELIALRELINNDCINSSLIPIIEPVKPTATLLKTIEAFVSKNREIAVILNPEVGDFIAKLAELRAENSKLANGLLNLIENNDKVIKSYIMNKDSAEFLSHDNNRENKLIINRDRDCLNDFLDVYERDMPRFTLIPDDRAFRRMVKDSKVLLEDCFNKKVRNVDYLDNEDEFFSDNHIYFKEENLVGFSDYSIVGEEFNESGFAPVAVAIHIVYFDKDNALRIHHFVSDSNTGIEDPAGKFGEALEKLVYWCEGYNVQDTLGLKGFYECFKSGKYPGLGTVKKYSIMHHLELVSNYLGGK